MVHSPQQAPRTDWFGGVLTFLTNAAVSLPLLSITAELIATNKLKQPLADILSLVGALTVLVLCWTRDRYAKWLFGTLAVVSAYLFCWECVTFTAPTAPRPFDSGGRAPWLVIIAAALACWRPERHARRQHARLFIRRFLLSWVPTCFVVLSTLAEPTMIAVSTIPAICLIEVQFIYSLRNEPFLVAVSSWLAIGGGLVAKCAFILRAFIA